MSAVAPTGLLTLIIGGALALMLVLILISIAYCARSPSKRGGHSQPLRTSSFQRLQTHAPSAPPSIVFPPAPASTLPRSERINERATTNAADIKELLTIKRYRVRYVFIFCYVFWIYGSSVYNRRAFKYQNMNMSSFWLFNKPLKTFRDQIIFISLFSSILDYRIYYRKEHLVESIAGLTMMFKKFWSKR